MSELDLTIPKNSTLPHAATQVGVYEKDRKTLRGVAVHDKSTVSYVEGSGIDRNKPVVNVVMGDPLVGLDRYISNGLLDGLHYPALSLLE